MVPASRRRDLLFYPQLYFNPIVGYEKPLNQITPYTKFGAYILYAPIII